MDKTQKCSTLPKKLPLCSFSDFQEEKKTSSVDSELFVQVCSMSACLHWTVTGMGDWFYWSTSAPLSMSRGRGAK